MKDKRLSKFLRDVALDRDLGPELVHREVIEPLPVRWGKMPGELGMEISAGLASQGIDKLWLHQSEAVRLVLGGKDAVVVTPTASGKTLCYLLPLLEICRRRPAARALALFPLKALEQDQLGAFRELAAACGLGDRVTADIYDGDTPRERREKIRRTPPNVVITNPDMLHQGILPHHERWEALFANLELIVIDELHTYRGVFGSHVAHVLRRLLRVAAFYGSNPLIVASSATIANPGEHAAALVGRPVQVVDDNGAPSAGRTFLFVNPRHLSASTVASRLLGAAVKAKLSTIVFTKARKMTELIHSWTVRHEPALRPLISAYRAGYLPEERREIETALSSGSLRGVISTSALEMGIDIGALDVCLLVGYPGAITTTWQRGGRVGREDRESLIVLIAQQDALDQYFMRHPAEFFSLGFEAATIDPGNRPLLKAHILCAASELPLTREDAWYGPSGGCRGTEPGEAGHVDTAGAVAALEAEGALLRAVGEDAWYSVRRNPQREVNIRGIGESFSILEEAAEGARPRVIGSLDGIRALSEGHPGAVYLHRAGQYESLRLDLEKRNVWVRPAELPYYTVPLREKDTAILGVRRSRPVHNFVVRLGDLRVTERITGFEKKSISSGERLSAHTLDLPPSSYETVGLWLELEDGIRRAVEGQSQSFMGGIHAVEHSMIALFPLFAFCERDDVGGISIPLHPEVGKGAIFLYDGFPGGVGLAEQAFARIEELLERTLDLIRDCTCEAGCPSCIYSSKCGNGNVPLDKEGAIMVLSLLLDRPESRRWLVAVEVGDEPPDVEPEAAAAPMAVVSVPRVLTFDLETKRGAADVGGWGNIHLMGLALAVVHDSRTDLFTTYHEHQAAELLADLAAADVVVGFNTLAFDYKVLSAYDDGTLARVHSFDMLDDIRRRLPFRIALNELASQTLGEVKTADGLQSLAWVREGRMDLVEEYCRHDVAITRDLFRHGLKEQRLRFRNREGKVMELAVDWDLEKLLRH